MNTEHLKAWGLLSGQDQPYYVMATEDEREQMRQWVTSLLQTNAHPVNITFVKADGTERTMPCTLHRGLVPESSTSSNSKRKYNPDVCVVFDPERQVWRSFRWDRMKRIEFELG